MYLFHIFLQLLSKVQCNVGSPTPLPTTLQQRYNQLSAPQCTNLTYINTFYYKILQINDADSEIINIRSKLSEAASN